MLAAAAGLCLATAAAPSVAKFYQLDEGVCLNGDKASLFAYHEPADSGAVRLAFGGVAY
eukprot:SAG22_NODE_1697_length_3790_cov_1.813601_1_plen_59_part_00